MEGSSTISSSSSGSGAGAGAGSGEGDLLRFVDADLVDFLRGMLQRGERLGVKRESKTGRHEETRRGEKVFGALDLDWGYSMKAVI